MNPGIVANTEQFVAETKFSNTRRKPKPGTIVLIVLLHIAAIYGLARAFAPGMVATAEQSIVSTFTVTVTTPDEPPPPPEENEPVPDQGAAGDPGKKATPKPVTAPKVPIPQDAPMPKASSTGSDDTSGAKETGEGTGAAGQGEGTGSGNSGSGRGGVAVTKAVKIAGSISSAQDYPVPEGGRQARFGTSVSVAILVGKDGLPKRCRVFRKSPFPETDRITCDLAMARFRFKPATDANGEPVESEFGWKQEFRQAR